MQLAHSGQGQRKARDVQNLGRGIVEARNDRGADDQMAAVFGVEEERLKVEN